MKTKVALITGCSSGIGEATAKCLAAKGFRVYATARKAESIAHLQSVNCKTLSLDVTDEASMASAVASIELAEGGIDVLVNNAGYSQSGAVESLPMERIRDQFETNVFGLVRLCQLVLPGMRKQGTGKIVNLSSMGGKLTFPGGGAYHASKYAVEAFSDALRFEVQGFGVDVIIIEPGIIKTQFANVVNQGLDGLATDGPYDTFNAAIGKSTREAYEKGMLAMLGGPPDAVAKVILKAISARRPKARYTVTASASVMLAQRAFMSDAGWDNLMRSTFPSPKAS